MEIKSVANIIAISTKLFITCQEVVDINELG